MDKLSTYALACRDAVDLSMQERGTLYLTEFATRLSTRRTGDQFDPARADILARRAQIRGGAFAVAPLAEASHSCD